YLPAVDFDERDDPPQPPGILEFRAGAFEDHQVVAQDASVSRKREAFDHPQLEVLLGAGHPPDSAKGQAAQMSQIDVGAIKDHDLSFPHASANLASPLRVAVFGCVNDGKPRQKT